MKNKIVVIGWVDTELEFLRRCLPYSDEKLQDKDIKVKITIERVKEIKNEFN